MKKQANSRHCFVCGVENKFGLHLTFYQHENGAVVVETIVPEHFQGYPGVVHGGIVASLVDEALGRVHMGHDPDHPRFMYTAKLTVNYRRPVPTNRPIKILAQAVKSKRRLATSNAQIIGPDDELLADAEAVLVNVPQETIDAVDMAELGWKVYPD